jgi:hypothetical protein
MRESWAIFRLLSALMLLLGVFHTPWGVARTAQALPQLPRHDQVASPEWKTRRAAFAQLIGLRPEAYAQGGVTYMPDLLRPLLAKDRDNSEARKLALIELLEIENKTVEREQQLSEAYVNYYGDVIAAVATVADPRSIDALVGAVSTGNMATGTLISFGNAAVEPVGKKLDSPDPLVRSSVARTLSQMLEKSQEISGTPASRAVIKRALVQAAKDNDPIVRRSAVDGLVTLGDAESIAIVDQLARNDPYQADFPGKEGKFLVREAAANALKRHER